MEPLVAEGLTKRFGSLTAVDRVSFRISEGEMYALLGPNGAGKSTAIRLLVGVLKPTSGKAWVVGLDVSARPYQARQNMGYMSQAFSLYGDLSVAENMEFFSGVYGAPRDRMRETIEAMGLSDYLGVLAKDLPLGFRQRLALAAATVHEPRVLFLDEPTAGTGPGTRSEFWDVVYSLRDQGTAVLMTTHHMDEARLADRVGMINKGRLIAEGTPRELLDMDTKREFWSLQAVPQNACLSVLNRAGFSAYASGGEVFFNARDPGDLDNAARLLREKGITVTEVRERKPSLEDVFLALTEEDSQA